MMLKFKNADVRYRGNVIWINTDYIVAVYEESEVDGGSLSTKIYGGPTITWTVEESLNEVIRAIGNLLMLTE